MVAFEVMDTAPLMVQLPRTLIWAAMPVPNLAVTVASTSTLKNWVAPVALKELLLLLDAAISKVPAVAVYEPAFVK